MANEFVPEMCIKVTCDEYRRTHRAASDVASTVRSLATTGPALSKVVVGLLGSMRDQLIAGQKLTDCKTGNDAQFEPSYLKEIDIIDVELKRRANFSKV